MEDEEMNDEMMAAMGFSGFGMKKEDRLSRAKQHSTSPEPASKRAKTGKHSNNMKPNNPNFQPLASRIPSKPNSNTMPLRSGEPSSTYTYPHYNLIPSSLPPKPPQAAQAQNMNPQDYQQQYLQPQTTGDENNPAAGQSQDSPYGGPSDSYPPPQQDHQNQQQDADKIVYTSPSGTPYTSLQLSMLMNGKVKNAKGDTVYFKPTFLEDPWVKFNKPTPVDKGGVCNAYGGGEDEGMKSKGKGIVYSDVRKEEGLI